MQTKTSVTATDTTIDLATLATVAGGTALPFPRPFPNPLPGPLPFPRPFPNPFPLPNPFPGPRNPNPILRGSEAK